MASATPDLVELFDVEVVGDDLPGASWNIAPTTQVRIVFESTRHREETETEPARRLESARWGLIPNWSKDRNPRISTFNARSETVLEKPLFKNAVARRRAIIPATGYFEWHTSAGAKVPYYIHHPDGDIVRLAGLYEWWRDPAASTETLDQWVLSTTILTQQAEGPLAGIHDRTPVFVSVEDTEQWLDPSTPATAGSLDMVTMASAELATRMIFHRVDSKVGNVRNVGPELIEEISL